MLCSYCYFSKCSFVALGAHASGTSFYARTVGNVRPLEVWGKALDGCAHRMAALDRF
jgi:hypothetical protein